MAQPVSIASLSATAHLASDLIVWRNHSDDFAHKSVAELGFVGLTLLGIVETVTRIVLSILAIPFTYCLSDDQKDLNDLLTFRLPFGAFTSGVVTIGCLIATIQNLCNEKFEDDGTALTCLGNIHYAIKDRYKEIAAQGSHP